MKRSMLINAVAHIMGSIVVDDARYEAWAEAFAKQLAAALKVKVSAPRWDETSQYYRCTLRTDSALIALLFVDGSFGYVLERVHLEQGLSHRVHFDARKVRISNNKLLIKLIGDTLRNFEDQQAKVDTRALTREAKKVKAALDALQKQLLSAAVQLGLDARGLSFHDDMMGVGGKPRFGYAATRPAGTKTLDSSPLAARLTIYGLSYSDYANVNSLLDEALAGWKPRGGKALANSSKHAKAWHSDTGHSHVSVAPKEHPEYGEALIEVEATVDLCATLPAGDRAFGMQSGKPTAAAWQAFQLAQPILRKFF